MTIEQSQNGGEIRNCWNHLLKRGTTLNAYIWKEVGGVLKLGYKVDTYCTVIFYKQHFFSTQPQCCLTFSWIQLQMLLRCCVIHITIIILRDILYLVYLCPCLGQIMLYLCDLFFIFSFIFIVINHITLLKQKHLFFVQFLECLLWMITWMKKKNHFKLAKVQPQGVD